MQTTRDLGSKLFSPFTIKRAWLFLRVRMDTDMIRCGTLKEEGRQQLSLQSILRRLSDAKMKLQGKEAMNDLRGSS